jgi:hypothetical protein
MDMPQEDRVFRNFGASLIFSFPPFQLRLTLLPNKVLAVKFTRKKKPAHAVVDEETSKNKLSEGSRIPIRLLFPKNQGPPNLWNGSHTQFFMGLDVVITDCQNFRICSFWNHGFASFAVLLEPKAYLAKKASGPANRSMTRQELLSALTMGMQSGDMLENMPTNI